MKMQRKTKIFTAIAIVLFVTLAILAGVYSTKDNHYVLDVMQEKAEGGDENLKITEQLVKPSGSQYHDSEKLDYKVTLKNINGENSDIQIAMVVDTSYSMQINDEQVILKDTAKDLVSSIFSEVSGVRMSLFSNSGRKVHLANNAGTVNNSINSLVFGESQDCNDGLEAAYNSGFTPSAANKVPNKTLIYFTDSTDNVSEKMREIEELDPTLKIITVLVDLTSSAYMDLNDGTPVAGKVYVIPSNVNESDLPSYINIYDKLKIYDELNSSANSIKVTNRFSDDILKYFEISDIKPATTNDGTVTPITEDGKIVGYEWEIDKIKYQRENSMTFSIKLDTNAEIDAGLIFSDLYTNEEQNITYNKFNTSLLSSCKGTDARSDTESTVIKICQGYDLYIKAVNQSNTTLAVPGVSLKVEGKNADGEVVCNLTKTTDNYGYIKITAAEARSLRPEGVIQYTVSATNSSSLVGYEVSDAILFAVDNNKITRKLEFDEMGSELEPENKIDESIRKIEVHFPVSTTKLDFEVRAQELDNSNVTLSACDFELIQPKLNNKYEMNILRGTTDENGVLHFNPTVMTVDGTYQYILKQSSAPNAYDVSGLTLIKLTFQNGRIVAADPTTNKITTMYNENVKAELDPASASASIDHVIVTVENLCAEQDPFDLELNLTDISDGTKLDGVSYLITTTNSLNQVRNEYLSTDANGQIKAKIFGTGFVTIKITEQAPKAGYAPSSVKEILVQRVNGVVQVNYANPPAEHNTAKYKVEYLLNDDGDKVGLKVDLGSQKKPEQNILKVKLICADELPDKTPVGQGIIYDLVDQEGNSYGPGISDKYGDISFVVGNKPQGTYKYTLIPDIGSIPVGFDLNKIDAAIDVNLEFDADTFITNDSRVLTTGGFNYKSEEWKKVTKENSIDYTHEVELGYYYEQSDTFKFNVELSQQNTTTKIAGAKFDIDISWNVAMPSGDIVTRTKTISKRETNANGLITTFIPKTSNPTAGVVKDVTIVVKEVEAKIGFGLDSTTEEIHLVNNAGTMTVDEMTPYDLGATNTDAKSDATHKGAKNVGNDVTYYFTNKARTVEDTYVNLNVRKFDPNGALVDGVKVKITSVNPLLSNGLSAQQLLDEDDNNLEKTIVTGSQFTDNSDEGEIIYNYNDVINGVANAHTIRVPGISTHTEQNEDVIYEMAIEELDANDEVKPGTTVKVRLIFRNLGNAVRLTNVETIYGNRLVIKKEFSSASDTTAGKSLQDSLGIYLANIQLDLYTEYDDIGNLSLDLKKQNKDGQDLDNAGYNIRIESPDGRIIRKGTEAQPVIVKNGSDSDDIELQGVTVTEDTLIYITEYENHAPLGYAPNVTETLKVTKVTDAGDVTLQHIDSSYNPKRLVIGTPSSILTAAGTIKQQYPITLIDEQLDVFNMQIDTIDEDTLDPVSGFTFNVTTDQGAYGNITSGVQNKIGGNPVSKVVTYTLTPVDSAMYYRKITSPITVKVVFDEFGHVDSSTLTSQTDSRVTITHLDFTEEGNLKFEVKVKHLDKLDVRVNTVDSIRNTSLTTAQYEITPSLSAATGTTSIPVAYMQENGTTTYKIAQTSCPDTFNKIGSVNFTVDYSDAKVNNVSIQTLTGVDKQPTIQKTGDKQVTITIYVDSKIPFEISNKAFFNTATNLQSANFSVSEVASGTEVGGTTGANGKAGIYVSKFVEDTSKIFLVKQKSAATGFATVNDFYVKVEFDSDRKITAATLVDNAGNPVNSVDPSTGIQTINNRFVTVGFRVGSTSEYNGNQNGIVTIEVRNYPEFKMNITDMDRRDGTPISGAEYKVDSTYLNESNMPVEFTSTNNVVTNANGVGVAHLDKTLDDKTVTYVIKDTDPASPATNYQSLGTDIAVNVTFDANGYVSSASLVNSTLSNIATVTTNLPATTNDDNFVVNVELKNNPLLKIKITTMDITDPTNKLNNVGYQVIGKMGSDVITNSSNINRVNRTGTPQTSISGQYLVNGVTEDGLSISYMDRTVENKDITYSIKEVKKAVGYSWIDNDVELKVTYDPDGKISTASIVSGAINDDGDTCSRVVNINQNDFEIEIEIYNNEVKEFGIHLVAEDTFKSTKKIDNLHVDAYLTDPDNIAYVHDGTYEFRKDNTATQTFGTGYDYSVYDPKELITGVDRNGDGTRDNSVGEDYKTMGQYVTSNSASSETRILRLDIQNATHNGIYLNDVTAPANYTDGTDNLGYIEGGDYYNWAKYQAVRYNYLVSVTFTDEGKITDAHVINGHNSQIGWLADDRYIEVNHSNYKLEVKLKLFPVLDLKAVAMDNYTSDVLDPSTYNYNLVISTGRNLPGIPPRDEYIETGYIGYGHTRNNEPTIYGDIYSGSLELYAPVEPGRTRKLFIYEDSTPNNYQQHRPRYLVQYYERLIGIIEVEYNEYGELKNFEICRIENTTDTDGNPTTAVIAPYKNESNTGYIPSDNLKEYNYKAEYYCNTDSEANAESEKLLNRKVDFKIGYALTTKINVTAVDEISNTPISNIKMYPLMNGDEPSQNAGAAGIQLANTFYEYDAGEKGYRLTNNFGKTSWQYWGAAEASDTNRYIIDSWKENSNEYNGYFFPRELASTSIGGSGNSSDYFVKLDVTYDENGKISNVTSIGHDTWGDNNATNITWDSATGNINVNMLFSRKFQFKLNKEDYYDSTINSITAMFKAISNDTTLSVPQIVSGSMTPLGKVYKNRSVVYTLSELSVQDGYYPVPHTIDFAVNFDKDGNITRQDVQSNDEYFNINSTRTSQTTYGTNKAQPDLTIGIKDKPAFKLDLRVIDKFYRNEGIDGVNLEITDDQDSSIKTYLDTNASGYARTGTNSYIVGPVYPANPGETKTVVYTIKQTSTATGYYGLSANPIKLQVVYNEAGKIDQLPTIISPTTNAGDVINLNAFTPSSYLGGREVKLQIMNMPKDIKLAIHKYDKTTNDPMDNITFEVTKKDVNSGRIIGSTTTMVTETDGNIVAKIDEFTTSNSGRSIEYTIHEKVVPDSYRKMGDITFVINYDKDGEILTCTEVQNSDGDLNGKPEQIAYERDLKAFDGQKVHMVKNISNDNAFDIVIINEDENKVGFGIEGSLFDVSLVTDTDSYTYTPSATATNGRTSISNLQYSGNMTINISQRQAGEGYRTDLDNNVEIKLNKGTSIYSLDLDASQQGILTDPSTGDVDTKNAEYEITNSDGTTKLIAKINVDEDHGKVYVTFTNETKTELTILKQDINSKVLLSGAKFEVTAEQINSVTGLTEVDSNGDPISKVITTVDNDTTDDKGELHFDLGVAPQQQKWKYTFREIAAPEGYPSIVVDLTMTVVFDQYGRVTIDPTNSNRLDPVFANSNVNCRNMIARIYNGKETPTYTVKVITRDADTNRIINDSGIELNLFNADESPEEFLEVTPFTTGSATNGSITKTGNIGIDGNKYTDTEVFGTNGVGGNGMVLSDRGVTYIDNVDQNGLLHIKVNQTEFTEGYVPGSQRTNGDVMIQAVYGEDPVTAQQFVNFTTINNDGLKVETNDSKKLITITILNESQVNLHIQDIVYGQDPIVPIGDISYVVTSQISTVTDLTQTDLNVTTPATNRIDGKSDSPIGRAHAQNTVIYTLKQITPDGYQPLDEDIEIEVKYDLNGNIKYYELLSSQQFVNIETKTGGKDIYVTVRNMPNIPDYKVLVEKHTLDTDFDLNAYDVLLPGVTYEVTVNEEETGLPATTFTRTTDENGLIDVPGQIFKGFGYITVKLKELNAPAGYVVESQELYFRFYRHEITGKLEEIDSDVNYEFIETDNPNYVQGDPVKVILKPLDKQATGVFTLMVNKYSKASNKLIVDNPAKFEARIIKEDDDGLLIYDDDLGEIKTNKKGKIEIPNIAFPQELGEYTLVLKETEAPIGYELIEDEMKINFTIGINPDEQIIITKVSSASEYIGCKGGPQLLYIAVKDDVSDEILEDEYSLDITKIDAKTGEPIEDMALFKVKLPDISQTSVYTETSQTIKGPGKLDYCYIEENKDYTVRLSHMKQPTSAGEVQYKFKEVVAPEGYKLIPEDLILTIDFEYDEDGKLYFANATSSNDYYLRINTNTFPIAIDQALSIDILNYEAQQTEFTVKYNANVEDEDVTVPDDQTKHIGVDISLDSMVPTRPGCTFKGWAILPTSTTVAFQPGDVYNLDQDITLYAIWDENLKISSTEYLIGTGTETAGDWIPGDLSEYEDGDLYIKGIRPQPGRDRRGQQPQNPGTKLDEFLSNITTNADTVKVYIPEIDSNGDKVLKEQNIVANDSLVATGMIAKFVKEDEEITITLIVRGDFIETGKTTGDGKIALTDYTKASQLTRRNLNTILPLDEDKQALDYYVDSTKAWLQNRQAIISTYTSKTMENMR